MGKTREIVDEAISNRTAFYVIESELEMRHPKKVNRVAVAANGGPLMGTMTDLPIQGE